VLPATPLWLSVMVSLPVREPVVVGLKATLTVQKLPAAAPLAQVLVWEKSPLAVMLEMVSAALPVLVSLTVWALPLVPTFRAEKVREGEDTLTRGIVPVPLKVTV
jgi:hypothetical protein